MLPQDFLNLVRSGGVAMVVIVGSAVLALAVTVDRIIALWGVVGSARELGDAVARHLFRGEVAEGREVKFTVYVKDGKAALKATPVKDS